jgi:hypothetical protein
MYSGGHRGAEAEFGKTAERWGIQEVNFSFEGHAIERQRGVQILGPDELDKGDVSMEIVSLRMGRTYARTAKIRQVIQSIFHMVNKGYHVITIGWSKAVPVGAWNLPSYSIAPFTCMIRTKKSGLPGRTTAG